ncbi:LysR family transcriptional regulator [Paraburkholderia nemoris]|uniref:HTH-type transcriptional regulator SyrM 1 n=1 Tax=Paraburkholderia nemoris TaxID=2793076 RepID=A0ABM8QCZ1_9BURK|nr:MULTISPECIES: LysR family transcriptional regulator [Paraburkholderia]MBK3809816.1 LysR family transcriptional regulator [Paraburkholderia aspalathi]CAE6690508.1 HTH-type transcriptional regulator SyrM 1 [Paraburkholderia nemoris]CAE6782046.1 HTH-type transcriptional regulator SyrM 1 [Paraburkholderia nemoris]
MPEPDLNLLFALDALLAEKNVTRAARSLHLSASAMSRTLTRLRAATGDPLLVRAGRQMVLTPYAEGIRERTQNIVQEARSLLRPSPAALDFSTLHRTLTIRVNEAFVEAFGAPLIAEVTALAPFVRLHFSSKPEKNAEYLRNGSADLEIGVLEEMGPEIRVQALFRDRYVGVVKKGHPLDLKQDVTIEQYAAFGHVVAPYGRQTIDTLDAAIALAGLERTTVAVVPSFPAALAVARASDLVALLPASFVNTQPAAAVSVYAFELPVATEGFTVSQMWHPRLENDPVHRWLRQLVLRMCRQQVSSG